jgi:hypothetical protein
MLKISKINPTCLYVYECVVKIVYYSTEDGNKKLKHHHYSNQCCGSGSGMEKKSGSRIREKHHGKNFREFSNNNFGLNIL